MFKFKFKFNMHVTHAIEKDEKSTFSLWPLLRTPGQEANREGQLGERESGGKMNRPSRNTTGGTGSSSAWKYPGTAVQENEGWGQPLCGPQPVLFRSCGSGEGKGRRRLLASDPASPSPPP